MRISMILERDSCQMIDDQDWANDSGAAVPLLV